MGYTIRARLDQRQRPCGGYWTLVLENLKQPVSVEIAT